MPEPACRGKGDRKGRMKSKNVADKGALLDRMRRALTLDSDLYKELISDTTANNRQALAAVAIASLANGFGVGFAAALNEGGLGFFGGLLVGLLAQGLAAGDAARAAVYLHGLAGDFAAWRGCEPALSAGDVVDALPEALRSVTFR